MQAVEFCHLKTRKGISGGVENAIYMFESYAIT